MHFYRIVSSHVPATKAREISHMLNAIHAQESRRAADRKARTIIENLRAAHMQTAADLIEQETLSYHAFPDIHWQKIRTNNSLERIMMASPTPISPLHGSDTLPEQIGQLNAT